MAVLRALVDATPLSIVVALVAFWVASNGDALPPLLVGPLAGVAALSAGTALSHRLQTDGRRFPLLRALFELVALD